METSNFFKIFSLFFIFSVASSTLTKAMNKTAEDQKTKDLDKQNQALEAILKKYPISPENSPAENNKNKLNCGRDLAWSSEPGSRNFLIGLRSILSSKLLIVSDGPIPKKLESTKSITYENCTFYCSENAETAYVVVQDADDWEDLKELLKQN